ncbi:unnamed protein product [Blepharisma stoltei]|uniref:Uncharacterized protein n=1 Tax=Blepharisma stoltei TaxID=1481888 RepID=A0AAU9JBB8_9CILI|nr:unnamed protein product [Blepharisma stoltei]
MENYERPYTPSLSSHPSTPRNTIKAVFQNLQFINEVTEKINEVLEILEPFKDPDNAKIKSIRCLNLTTRQTERFKPIISEACDKLNLLKNEDIRKLDDDIKGIENSLKSQMEANGKLKAELHHLHNKFGLFEEELRNWRAQLEDAPLAMVESIASTLRKYTEFSKEKHPKEQFTRILESFMSSWNSYYPDTFDRPPSVLDRDVFIDDDFKDSENFYFKINCENCNSLRAELDQSEMNLLSEIEKNYNLQRDKENEVSELKKQLEKAAGNDEIDYEIYIKKIRTDIENLLDCELPDISNDPKTSLPELWMKIRKVIGESAKRCRSKAAPAAAKQETNYIDCNAKDIENLKRKLDEIYDDIENGKPSKVYKIMIAASEFSLLLKKVEDSWNLNFPKKYEIALNAGSNKKIISNKNPIFDSLNSILSEEFSEAENLRLTELENKLEELTELSYQINPSIQQNLSAESNTTAKLYEEIKEKKEEISKLAHELERKTIENKKLSENIEKYKNELMQVKSKSGLTIDTIEELKSVFTNTAISDFVKVEYEEPEEIVFDIEDFDPHLNSELRLRDQEIKKLQKEKAELLEKLDKSSPFIEMPEINLNCSSKLQDSQEISDIKSLISQKENELENLPPGTSPNLLNREIIKLKSKLQDIKTKKALDAHATLQTRLSRSMAKIEKDWLITEEKSKRVPSNHSKRIMELDASRSLSPDNFKKIVAESQRYSMNPNFSFRSINLIKQKRIQNSMASGELEYLRTELEKCLEEKSNLEVQLKKFTENDKLEEKWNEVKAKEQTAEILIERALKQEEKLKEERLANQKHLKNIEKEYEDIRKEKAKLKLIGNELKEKEKQIELKSINVNESPYLRRISRANTSTGSDESVTSLGSPRAFKFDEFDREKEKFVLEKKKMCILVSKINNEKTKINEERNSLAKERALLEYQKSKFSEILPKLMNLVERDKN